MARLDVSLILRIDACEGRDNRAARGEVGGRCADAADLLQQKDEDLLMKLPKVFPRRDIQEFSCCPLISCVCPADDPPLLVVVVVAIHEYLYA